MISPSPSSLDMTAQLRAAKLIFHREALSHTTPLLRNFQGFLFSSQKYCMEGLPESRPHITYTRLISHVLFEPRHKVSPSSTQGLPGYSCLVAYSACFRTCEAHPLLSLLTTWDSLHTSLRSVSKR